MKKKTATAASSFGESGEAEEEFGQNVESQETFHQQVRDEEVRMISLVFNSSGLTTPLLTLLSSYF